jgi:hypothetical protein
MDEIDKRFEEWLDDKYGTPLNEAMQTSRYSVEVNYRSKTQEVVDSFAKLVLGYVSAGMKNCGYHTKVMFTDKPFRVLISTRNWDDGEWVGCVTFNHESGQFVIVKGVYHKDRKTISVHNSRKTDSDSAATIVRELRNLMESLKRTKPHGSNTLEPVQLKRGPKPTHLKGLKKVTGPWKPNLPKVI